MTPAMHPRIRSVFEASEVAAAKVKQCPEGLSNSKTFFLEIPDKKNQLKGLQFHPQIALKVQSPTSLKTILRESCTINSVIPPWIPQEISPTIL